MTAFENHEQEAATGEAGGLSAARSLRTRSRAVLTGSASLVRRHPVFAIVFSVSVLLRLVVMLAYQPAILFRLDSFDYLWGALHPSPNVINPSGYSLFLWLLLPFHSFVVVAVLQHLMGLGIGVMIYAILRRYRLPGWGATLATLPVLFDPGQILLEQSIMANLLAMALMMGALTIVLLAERGSLWWLVTAGVLIGLSVLVWPATLPLIILMPAFLLIRRAGWRRAGAVLAAGVLPVVAYMGWFDAVHGSFNLSNSNGLFLWSRTMSFANCSVINPPASLRPLCPEQQPGILGAVNPARRPPPKSYLWGDRHGTWEWKNVPPQFVPDTGAFTEANNSRALRFALKAIMAQPTAYAGVVIKQTLVPFTGLNKLNFPVGPQPKGFGASLSEANYRYAYAAANGYAHSTGVVTRVVRYNYATVVHKPYASIFNGYQRVIFLPGPLLGILALVGLAGALIPGRRSAAGWLMWLSALIIIVLPTAEHEYDPRYDILAVPLICVAAALAFRKPEPKQDARQSPERAAESAPAVSPGAG